MTGRAAGTRLALIGIVVVAAGLLSARQAHAGGSLDPFRSSAGAAPRLNPFRVAQAAPPPAASPPPAAPAPKACRTDEDCPAENICSNQKTCQPIQISTNFLYLYYREGNFREILGLYWSKTGPTGYTVLAPFYWHFWTPDSATYVIVPGLPVSWSRQPGARSFGVWPLFYASTKFGWAAPLFGTFKIGDPDRGESMGAIAFLYWWRRQPQHSFDLLFPLFASWRSPPHSFTYALPLNIYWRDNDDANTLAIPFFYSNQHKTGGSFYTLIGYGKYEGAERSGAALWLYWFGEDRKEKSSYDIFIPLYWDFRNRDGGTSIFFPLVWSFRSANDETTVAGPFVRLRSGASTTHIVFPFWWSNSDSSAGTAFRLFVPLFFWQKSEHGRKVSFLSPLAAYSRDDTERSKMLLILPLFSLYHNDPDDQLRFFTPLYIRHHDYRTLATTHLIGLLLFLRRDGGGSTTVLFPLFWHFRDQPTGATATALLPFYAHRSGPRDRSTFLLGAYWRSFTGGGWSGGFFPLAFFADNGGRSHQVIFPLFWRFAAGGASTTVAVPLFYWQRDRHGYNGSVLPLLTFLGDRDGESYAVQFPLYWHFASEREGWSTTATPIGYYHRDRDGWSGGIIPVFVRSGSTASHFVVFPVFWHVANEKTGESTTVALTYLHHTWGNETTDAFFPLFHYRRGVRPGGRVSETSFTIFPLLVHYHRNEWTRVLFTPVYASARGPRRAAGFVGPYLWYRDAAISARGVPFLYADVTRPATGERTRQYGLWFQIDGPGRSARMLYPFFLRYDDAHEHDTYVFPTYFRQRRSDGYAVDSFLPFFWRSEYQGRTTTVVGPFYDRSARGLHDTGLVPLWFYAKNDQRSITVIPPLLFFRRRDFDTDSERIWCALYYHRREGPAYTTAIFPLWLSGAADGQSHAVLFPIFWHFADERAQSSSTAFTLIYWSSHGTSRMRALLPLAWYTRDSAQGTGSEAFLPLFYHAFSKDRFTLLTVLAGYRGTPTSHLWYVLPALFSNSIESKFGMVAPFWFSHTNKVTETTTTVAPPLLYVSHGNPESGLATVLAIFWRHHDIGSATTLGLPLYFDVNDYHQSRTTVFLPLFVRYRREADQNVYWVAPLFYRHTSPTESSTVFFPLVWDFRSPDESTTVVAPFYARWRRPGYVSTYVFPFNYYRKGLNPDGTGDGTYALWLLPFYDAAVKRPGDFRWEVLGGLFGNERIGRHSYLRLFWMNFETSAPTQAQTAWYSQPPRASRRNPPRGLSMNRW
jgi:hypothetical protein